MTDDKKKHTPETSDTRYVAYVSCECNEKIKAHFPGLP